MSDSNGMDLAGVIGTWVAAFLAIVALVGVLPVVLLYRQSKTKKAQALALLDDPSGIYVTNTLRLGSLHYRKIGKVPNLVSPPNTETLEYDPQWKRQLQNESTSGWINFSYVINAVFPNRDQSTDGDDTNLVFQDGEAFLLVHRAWILVLAVLHCYAYRQDYGLPKENPSQDHIKNIPWNKTIAGLSGGLFNAKHRTNAVTFMIHPRSEPTVLEGRADIKALVLLSFGFVKMTNGTNIRFHTPGQRSIVPYNLIARLVDDPVSSTESTLFSDMRLEVGETKTFEITRGDLFENPRGSRDAHRMEAKEYMNLGRFRPSGQSASDIWIHRGDLYRLTAGYLSARFRSQGFLYAKSQDLIVSKLFSAKHTKLTLRWGQDWASRLNLKENERMLLTVALEKVSKLDLEKPCWSREAMQNLYELDQVILLACKSSDWKFRSISVLFVCEKRFRAIFAKDLEREEDESHRFIQFSARNQKVELGQLEGMDNRHQAVFQFDFMSVFAFNEPPTDSEFENLSIAQAVFAAIQGQIRAIMWKMSLSPRGLHDFLIASYDDIFRFSTRPARVAQSLHRNRARLYDFGSETGSTPSSDSDEVAESDPETSDRRVETVISMPHSTQEDSAESHTSHESAFEALNHHEMPLHAAANRGDEAEVRLWIERGFNKNANDSERRIALYLSAAHGHLLIVQYLVSIGAGLELSDQYNVTPLFVAAEKGQLNVVRFLLDKGADSEVRDCEGSTALMWAARMGEKAVVEVLLKNGAEKDTQNNRGSTALFYACAARRWDVAKVLLENGVDCNISQYTGATPLHVAGAYGGKDIVQYLLEKGADISRKDAEGKTALQRAVWLNHEEDKIENLPASVMA
ncbi:hypothetical protein E8E14_010448 [Neopestalotiopsis sp. 37M]|nr:hypothetical protein E8E14_010448 [Neopestalotiopsis sp. 37M]